MMLGVSKELPDHMMCCAYNPGTIATDMIIEMFGVNVPKAIEAGAIGPDKWAKDCIPHILKLTRNDNGQKIERPGGSAASAKHNWAIYRKVGNIDANK